MDVKTKIPSLSKNDRLGMTNYRCVRCCGYSLEPSSPATASATTGEAAST